jgi:excisionase family DNA binding protein
MDKDKEKKAAPASGRKERPEVMTIDQVAEYLQLHKQVVYRHVKNKNIPVSRIGSTLRFKKSVIDAWLEDSALKSLRLIRGRTAESVHSPFNVEED